MRVERLPLHAHPDRRFALSHLTSPFGKTEAWLVLEARPGGVVHLGFSRDVDAGELRRWVERQQVDAIVSATNVVPVYARDALVCPAGMPHAIGEGILLVELQEPTDFSVLLHWEGFDLDGPAEGHLGLGLDVALARAERSAATTSPTSNARESSGGASVRGPSGCSPSTWTRFPRRAAGARSRQRARRELLVLVVTAGQGQLSIAGARPQHVRAGCTLVVPFAAGPARLEGDVQAVRCLPARTPRS